MSKQMSWTFVNLLLADIPAAMEHSITSRLRAYE